MDYVNKYENRTLWGQGNELSRKFGATLVKMRARPPGLLSITYLPSRLFHLPSPLSPVAAFEARLSLSLVYLASLMLARFRSHGPRLDPSDPHSLRDPRRLRLDRRFERRCIGDESCDPDTTWRRKSPLHAPSIISCTLPSRGDGVSDA